MTDPNQSTADLRARAPAALDLEQRAAEVRREHARRQAEHGALDLALSVRCSEHGADKQQPCYPPPAGGVCGHRITNSLHLARVRRARQQREARR